MPRLTLPEARAAMDRAEAAYARCKARVDSYAGPLRGDLFARRTQAWRAATLELDRAARELRRAKVEAYLTARKARINLSEGEGA